MRQGSDGLKDAVGAILAERGWSYREAARQTTMSPTTVSDMAQHGKATPGAVIQWAVALGLPVNDWLALAGYPPIPPRLVAGEGVIIADETAAYEADRKRVVTEAVEAIETALAGMAATLGEHLRRIKEA